jgi:hypothetical protein
MLPSTARMKVGLGSAGYISRRLLQCSAVSECLITIQSPPSDATSAGALLRKDLGVPRCYSVRDESTGAAFFDGRPTDHKDSSIVPSLGGSVAERSWRRLDGHNQLPKVILGIKFADGIEVVRLQAQAAT